MTAVPAGLPLGRIRRPGRALAVLAALAVAALAACAWSAARGGDPAPRTLTGGGGAYTLDVPAGWSAASAAELAATPSRPDALLRRDDGRGLVVVRQRPPMRRSLTRLARGLQAQLVRRMPDVRPVGARVVRLATGAALSYTFVRTRSGQVQGIVVAPLGDRTVTIESVAAGDAHGAARDIGAIVRSLRR